MPPRRRRARRQRQIDLPSKPSDIQLKALHKYLDRIYFDDTSGGAFGSPGKLLSEVKRRGYYLHVGLQRIKNYLNKHETYTLYKQVIAKFPTPPVFVTGVNEQMDMDLMDISKDSSDNQGIKYLLTSIDILSKFAMVRPLKTKEGKEVAREAGDMFDERKPVRVQTDLGECVFL